MKSGIIYKATGPTGKVYIGKTVAGLEARRRQHCSNAFNKNHVAYNTKFYRAIRKYGKMSFKWTGLIDGIIEDDINRHEIDTICKFNSYKCGYNSTLGGEGISGLKHKQAMKDKLSKLNSKKYSGKGNPRYGIKMSQKLKDKISKSHIGKKLSEDHKRKIGLGVKGKVIPKDIRRKMAVARGSKEFDVSTVEGKYIGRWINQRECARDLGVSRAQIRKCLCGKRQSSGSYVFMYRERK